MIFLYFCTMKCFVFNPEHDIALSVNSEFWTAPHAGRQLRSDLGWLPAIWGEKGDVILVDDVESALSSLKKSGILYNKGIKIVDIHQKKEVSAIGREADEMCVWGWDKSIVSSLGRSGIPRTLMPSDEDLAFIRSISDRATSSLLLEDIKKQMPRLRGESQKVMSLEELENKVEEWGRIVLKSPWSSSGRGVRYAIPDTLHQHLAWAGKVVRTQGHLMVEKMLEKVMDFGMEFSIGTDGIVRYEGLSLFKTVGGAYEGSVLATEEEKMEILTTYISETLLEEVYTFICLWMKNKLQGRYHGFFGVDMMVVKDSEQGLAIDPCVEINLRRTMGHVALALSPKERGRQELMKIMYEGNNYHFRKYPDCELLY